MVASIAEDFEHCSIHAYQSHAGWGWNIYEDDNVIGTLAEEATFPNQEAALSAAREVAEKIEERWKNYGYDWLRVLDFIEVYNKKDWEKPTRIWIEQIPGSRAWTMYRQQAGELEPMSGTLLFSGMGGWRGIPEWVNVFVQGALRLETCQ